MSAPGGVPASGGVCSASWGCLLWWGVIPACTEADPPLPAVISYTLRNVAELILVDTNWKCSQKKGY